TAQHRIAEALAASEARFRELADAMPQVVWSADSEGRVDYYNKRWQEVTGMPPPATAGGVDPWRPVLHPDDVRLYSEAWRASVNTGRNFEFEYRIMDQQSGVYRWYLGRAVPIRDQAGRIARWFGTATDIDDRK